VHGQIWPPRPGFVEHTEIEIANFWYQMSRIIDELFGNFDLSMPD
jgi:hypothetical protein